MINIDWKKAAIFAGGVLFGTAGIKVLGSKDAKKAHILNVLDVQRYDRDMRMFEDTVKKITEAVVLPEPMKDETRRGM